MEVTARRAIDPATMDVQVNVTEADVQAAFADATDPDEELYYKLFGPEWTKMPNSGKLEALTALAGRLERKGIKVSIVVGAPEPK